MFDLTNRAKPVLKWAGGKSGVLEQLLPFFPNQFDRYVEPFLGGSAVSLALDSSSPVIANDANPELIEFYESLRDQPDELMELIEVWREKYSESFYYELRKNVGTSKIERAARLIYLNKAGFNGLYRLNSKGEFNVPFGKRPYCPAIYDRENIYGVSARLKRWRLTSEDFAILFEKCGKGDFVYCDPPYDPLSETACFHSYRAGGFSKEDQRRLKEAAESAARCGATVALSNSSTPFIRELYKDWPIHSIRARRNINSKGDGRGEVEEVLVVIKNTF